MKSGRGGVRGRPVGRVERGGKLGGSKVGRVGGEVGERGPMAIIGFCIILPWI